MKIFLILIFSLLFGGWAQAETYGYLQIQVPSPRADHTFVAHMSSNGARLMTFSHATSVTTAALGSQHLYSGSTTPISADYTFGEAGCSFDYLVYFSISSNGPWIKLPGTFKAPNGKSADKIPLGICGNSVCSSDPSIQRQIKEQRIQKAKSEARQVKAQIERSKKDRERRAAAIYAKAMEKRATKIASPVVAPEDRQQLAQTENRLNEQVQNTNVPDPKANGDLALDTEAVQADADKAYFESLKETYKKDALESGHDISDEFATKVIQAVVDWKRQLGIYDPTIKTEQQALMTSLLNMDTLTTLAGIGVRLTPLGDAIDACEAITGRANCLPNGAKLSNLERAASVLGLMIANRQMWAPVLKSVSAEVKLLTLGEKTIQKLQSEGRIAFRERELIKDTLKAINQDVRYAGVVDDLRIQKVSPANEINKLWSEPAFPKDGHVFYAEINRTRNDFVRVHGGGDGVYGEWFARYEDIVGLSPEQIKNKLNLKYAPTTITRMEIQEGTPVMAGLVGKNSFGAGEGTIQYKIEGSIKKYIEEGKIKYFDERLL